jgi:glutamyl-tRNA synthetase
MYKYFGWKYPEAIHYGRMKIAGASLSKSKIVQGMQEGIYQSWDDPRLATFAALRRRGIKPEAIRQLIIDVGPKSQDLTLSWENLYAHNRKLVEPIANRYFFIGNPLKMIVRNIPKSLSAKVALHPDHPERGFRQFVIEPDHGVARAWVSSKDANNFEPGQVVRLMGAFNVKIGDIEENSVETVFHSKQLREARELKAPLIHWIPEHMNLKCRVVLPTAHVLEGLAEDSCAELEADTIVQFERFGFVRIDSNEKHLVTAYYCHR